MGFQTEIWDLNDIIAKLEVALDKAGHDAYAENLAQTVKRLKESVGWLEEAEATQPPKLTVVQ